LVIFSRAKLTFVATFIDAFVLRSNRSLHFRDKGFDKGFDKG